MGVTMLLKPLKTVYHEINGVWFHKYKIDLAIQPKWSFFQKLKYNRLGFTNEDYYNFNLKNNDYHAYISYRERWRLEDINGRFAYILGEKLLFERIFGRFINVPHINCWVKNGKFLDMDAGEEIDILSVIKEKKELIAKPTRSGGGGAGIKKLSFDGESYYIDADKVLPEDITKQTASLEEYIIVDYIKQADYSDRIYQKTTNSIRVVTARRKNGEYEVLLAFHRFGSDLSCPVDNISSGGMVVIIDTQTGKMGKAKQKTNPNKLHEAHPDSGSQIEGVFIPGWEKITEKLLHVHSCFPYYTFLAWDVVIGTDGNPNILEINRGSDLTVQMIEPLRNSKLGDFMKEYGLLDKR